jgi:aromatic-L-amino-acid decarboxylase
MKPFFDLSVEEMKSYGYKIVDLIAEHYHELENKKPVTIASRQEMDSIFFTRST